MFYLSRFEQIALCVLLALLLTGAGVLLYAKGHHSAREGAQKPVFVSAAASTAGRGEIVVDVSGEVVEPGVYRLSSGARAVDALEQAGGATAEADVTALNLAARLHDGDQIIVPSRSPARPAAAPAPARSPGKRRISLNRATAQELESLPGIGPVYAQRIIEHRERKMREEGHGFQSLDELLNVPGIGPRRLAALRDRVYP